MKRQPILLIDFDGVLHSYTSGWQGAKTISDPPVPGAMAFLREASKHFHVNIYSSRSRQWGGKKAMKNWLLIHLENFFAKEYPELALVENPFREDELIPESMAKDFVSDDLKFPTKKPAAFLTIDDRAFCFKGEFPVAKDLLKFKPWNKG